MLRAKLEEIIAESRLVLNGRSNLIDSLVPPILFVMLNAWLGFNVAMWASLVVALLITLYRLTKGESLLYALTGVGGVILAIVLARWLDRAEAFFLPGIITGGLTVLVAVVSSLLRRPMVAWTSHFARGWPWAWYWHPEVRPAYSEVTWLWAFYFALRLLLQLSLFNSEAVNLLLVANFIGGWPATTVLLVISYVYGTWRLRNLKGPSVEEFKSGTEPPWEGQKRGF